MTRTDMETAGISLTQGLFMALISRLLERVKPR